jgi:hypothetical protein
MSYLTLVRSGILRLTQLPVTTGLGSVTWPTKIARRFFDVKLEQIKKLHEALRTDTPLDNNQLTDCLLTLVKEQNYLEY